MDSQCFWCGGPFIPRSTGGSAQRFCIPECRRAFDSACRRWTSRLVDAGFLPVEALKSAAPDSARAAQVTEVPPFYLGG